MPSEPDIEVELNLHRSVVPGYMPHFRVGDGEMLGVGFIAIGPIASDGSLRATVRLMYWPQVNYDALQSGASFNVLEGPRVVGHGRVLKGQHAI
jgi:hypothetical protein